MAPVNRVPGWSLDLVVELGQLVRGCLVGRGAAAGDLARGLGQAVGLAAAGGSPGGPLRWRSPRWATP
jgi:hypothetical protein